MKDLSTATSKNEEAAKYKNRQVIRKSDIQRFSSSFNSRCLLGNCLGWKMHGSYFTETVVDGSH